MKIGIIASTNKLIKNIFYYDELESTNTLMLTELDATYNIKQKFGYYDVVVTDKQTKGHGRYNRAWSSPQKENIYMSITAPILDYNDFCKLNIRIAVGIQRTLKKFGLDNTKIKWANDVVVTSSRSDKSKIKKIAGILFETRIDPVNSENSRTVIGVGVNINSKFSHLKGVDDDLFNRATSLYEEKCKLTVLDDVRLDLISEIDLALYDVIVAKNFNPKDIWESSSAYLGELITITHNGEKITVRELGVNDVGELIVTNESVAKNGVTQTINLGEIGYDIVKK